MLDETENEYIPLCWSMNNKGDHLIDREVDIFDLFLSINDLENHKSHLLKDFKKDDFQLFESSVVIFCLPQVYHFLEFFSWISLKYSSTMREICLVMSLGYCGKFHLSPLKICIISLSLRIKITFLCISKTLWLLIKN